MKRYLILSSLGFLIFSLLFYFYTNSESRLAHKNEKMLKLFSHAEYVETALEKDLLKSRNFLLLNYDPIVGNEFEINQICKKLQETDFAQYLSVNDQLESLNQTYCSHLEKKLENIERFKSKNSIYKNSIYFIHQAVVDFAGSSKREKKIEIQIQRDVLVKTALTYSIVSTEESKKALINALKEVDHLIRKDPTASNLSVIKLHAEKILNTKETLDALTSNILEANSREYLNNIRETYFKSYSKAEAEAMFHRKILFLLCALFLGLIVYGITRLWKAASRLADANANLEKRVIERTHDLQKSQELVTQQQQTLASSAKMLALGEMAGGMAHEINTPLATIKIISEQIQDVLKEESVDKGFVQSATNDLIKTCDRIANIINGLRSFARTGKNDPLQSVKVSDVINETLVLCRERLYTNGIEMTINEIDSNLNFEVRKSEISQVLLNLITNASDAVMSLEKKWIRIEVTDLSKNIEIKVIDSGEGISQNLQNKLFQPFFTTKEIGKGTGLALSVALGIARNHNGILKFDPTQTNTTFILSLPKTQIKRETYAA